MTEPSGSKHTACFQQQFNKAMTKKTKKTPTNCLFFQCYFRRTCFCGCSWNKRMLPNHLPLLLYSCWAFTWTVSLRFKGRNVETQGCSVSVGSGVFSLSNPRHVQHSIIHSVHWNRLRIITFQKENTTNLLRSIIPKLKNEKRIISPFLSTFPKRGSVHPQRKARPDGVAPSLSLHQIHSHVNQWRHQRQRVWILITALLAIQIIITAACYQTHLLENESKQYND